MEGFDEAFRDLVDRRFLGIRLGGVEDCAAAQGAGQDEREDGTDQMDAFHGYWSLVISWELRVVSTRSVRTTLVSAVACIGDS